MNKKVALLILDGWGHGDHTKSDGIFNANTPFMDDLEMNQPAAELLTHGENVGLPEGQMGNSEVGHLNIGAGRIVYQELTRINKAIKEGEFQKNPVLLNALNKAKKENRKLHLMGLVSTGGVHSSLAHLFALCDLANEMEIPQTFVHAFTDGRDCNPTTGLGHLEALENHIKGSNVKVASVIGRYYAMDRDKRWERIKIAYDLLVHGEGEAYTSSIEAIQASYSKNVTDEFITANVIVENGEPLAKIEDGDIVICFNFRTDRCREITMALTQQHFHEQNMHTLDLHYLTMTNYDKTFKGVHVIFENDNLPNTLGEVVSNAGMTQLRIAETEKYPHVSFFFSGGREKEFKGESRIMIPSPKVATYDMQPEMSASEIKDAVIAFMENETPDFICLNFANTDMVGHTGVYEAIIKAAEHVDSCVKEVVEKGKDLGYSFIIIADHGNSDFAINPDGSPNTAHSMNPVPVIVIDKDVQSLKNGILQDVAPTILELLGVSQPKEMTGSSLIG
ncbi:2,3-bisphosphoglycerate-independent phosphoglycerate mutase [Paracrocinitomix mangrovi]|uniref:2,3-bisphosphoglycerate-independent phosphoglycerate mutase n=1 Tax=Paracrocinitomix mangrovi TaxID=2862509 RepID=UPI001C8ED30B|nr:2,3-bisphosphoglycerate-independent phosphoglycerate mutase [Paracrocinitomix mangrovi]UKN03532.1 2,3-bisphosphoglycerate-independent phosphoglycerate mutase [Paracrocinitomix mangrovi]